MRHPDLTKKLEDERLGVCREDWITNQVLQQRDITPACDLLYFDVSKQEVHLVFIDRVALTNLNLSAL